MVISGVMDTGRNQVAAGFMYPGIGR